MNNSLISAAASLERHKDALVLWVADKLYETHPDWPERFGPKGRRTCEEDIAYHVEFLRTGLLFDSSKQFTEYCQWLNNILLNRGVETTHLIESLKSVRVFIEAHLPGDEAALCSSLLQAGHQALETAAVPIRPSYFDYLEAPADNVDGFTEALVTGDSSTVQMSALQLQNQGWDPVAINTRLIQPAMYEIGTRWETNRISVAQEHLATALAQTLMARVISQAEYASPSDRHALFACLPGNFHSLGLRMVSDAFEIAGWQVQFLGADVPLQALLRQVDSWRPEVLGLSISNLVQFGTLKFCLNELRSELGNHCPALMVGGLAPNQAPQLARQLGADIWAANPRKAIEAVQ